RSPKEDDVSPSFSVSSVVLKPLCLGIAPKQFLHRQKERLSLVKDGVDLIDYRRFHLESTRAFEGAFCRRYSLRHHFHISLDLGQSLGPAQSFPDATIPAMFAEAGGNQIAYTA